jgi:hypothetical protein
MNVPENIVDRLHADFRALAEVLDRAAEPSLRSTADDCFRKALLLAAASHFESKIVALILAFVEGAGGSSLIAEFVRQKALSRQYHSLFDWDANNANRFFGLFGKEFREYAVARVKANRELDEAVRAFIEMGRDRNRLVHQDFGNFAIESTADEIYERFKRANRFVEDLPGLLADCPLRMVEPPVQD